MLSQGTRRSFWGFLLVVSGSWFLVPGSRLEVARFRFEESNAEKPRAILAALTRNQKLETRNLQFASDVSQPVLLGPFVVEFCKDIKQEIRIAQDTDHDGEFIV